MDSAGDVEDEVLRIVEDVDGEGSLPLKADDSGRHAFEVPCHDGLGGDVAGDGDWSGPA